MDKSEHEEKCCGYKYVGHSQKISTVMLRYAILAKIFGVHIPGDIEIKTLENAANTFKSDPHTPTSDNLIFLYGAGVLDTDSLNLLLKCSADISDDVIAAENKIIGDVEKNEYDRMKYELICKMLVCAANSKQYDELQSMTFADAEKVAALNNVDIHSGFVKIIDKEYIKFLVEIGESFAFADEKKGIRIEELADNVIDNDYVQDGNVKSGGYPFLVNPLKLIYYARVYYKQFGKDFIKYAKQNGIPLDESYETEYEKYVKKTKLHFEVRSYKRKRNICASKVNWFDYAASEDGIIVDNLKDSNDVKTIDLEVKEDYTDDELLKKAVDRYSSIYPFENDTVVEVYHNTKEYLYVYSDGKLQPVDSKAFHNMLFDFNKIWGIIQMCSRNNQLKRVNDRIVIPEEIWNEIKPEQRIYANNLIKEQYSRMVEHRKTNKLIQSLSDLKAAADEVNKQKQAQNQQKHIYMTNAANRPSSTEE